jgi:hypothetical protein
MKRFLAFLLSFLLGAGSALAQSGETINQLSAGAALQGTEQIPMFQGSNPAVTTTPSAVATYAVGSPRSGLNGWVNIKDPAFGATGNGTIDDTAAIQAAIDYAFAHGLPGVYCPNGVYKTSSTIYLDPPGNLRSNFSAPTNFDFTMAFSGDPSSGWDHIFGCQIAPNFNNGIAFIVGPGQSMRVSDIKMAGPNNGYRGNLNSNGVGIGIAGGNGGASGTLIENTRVDNFYTLYKTNANNACCLGDNNSFRKVGGSNGYYGINIYGPEVYINDITDPYLEGVTVGISGQFDQVKVTGGVFLGGGRSSSFSVSGVSFLANGCTGMVGPVYCITATIAAPDSYIPNVYNTYTILTQHYGVIPLVMTSFNSSNNLGTFAFYEPWQLANYGRSTNLQFNSSFVTEIQAVTTLYAAEQMSAAQGVGIDLDGMHIETGACTSVMTLQNSWGSQVSSKVTEPYFDYDPSLVTISTTQAQKFCQQSFPIVGGAMERFSAILYNNAAAYPRYSLDLEGGNWGVATNPLIIDVSPWTDIVGSRLGTGVFNLRLFDYDGAAYHQLGQTRYWNGSGFSDATVQFASEARGTGLWDNDYFLPQSAQENNVNSVLLAFFQQSELTSYFCGYEPCPWATPNLSPTTYALVSGSLGALGTYPPIACRTVFKSVDWNTGAATPPSTVGGGIFKRSASCPGYSWGQNLTTTTLGATTNAVVTGTISNGSGGSGTILNVSAVTSGALHTGDQLTGASVPASEHILWQTSGTAGGVGTYLVSDAATITTGETLTDPVAAWVYQAGSDILYLDASTIQWAFPGLGISIDNGSGAQPYTVTGVYPSLGYVTVMWASSNNGGALQGAAGTNYSCSSSCTIGQAQYIWGAY